MYRFRLFEGPEWVQLAKGVVGVGVGAQTASSLTKVLRERVYAIHQTAFLQFFMIQVN
jgi:hypothetical protein